MKKSKADWTEERLAMVRLLADQYHVHNERILRAMEQIPRHLFIPESFRPFADPYGDHPCPIGRGQTVSQPFIVAHMTEKLSPQPGEKVLEIGAGSGYQSAETFSVWCCCAGAPAGCCRRRILRCVLCRWCIRR